VIIWAIKLSDSDFRDRWDQGMRENKASFIERAQWLFATMKDEISPARHRPTNLMQQEDDLKMMAPQVFRSFTRGDWNRFWGLVYDPFYEGKGVFKSRGYYSKDEIEGYLKKKYPDTFESFNKQQWDGFWQILGKDRAIRSITYGSGQSEDPEQRKMLDQMK
jgi:hypothetical protein